MSEDVKMKVDAGVCRFITNIVGSTDDGMTIRLSIESGCPSVKKLAAELKEVMLFDAISTPITENPLYVACAKTLPHAACVIPSALVKVCEVAGDLGLKREVKLQFV